MPPLETADEFVARMEAENAACVDPDDRVDDPREHLLHVSLEWERWYRFHADRCAACGHRRNPLVLDHCHETGQWRGELCRSCNVLEGRSAHVLYERYRRWHPAAILGLYEPYTGVAWTNGWSWVQHGGDKSRGPRRPPTAWPEWGPDCL